MSFQSVLDMLPGKGTGKKRQRRKDANNLLGDDDDDFEEIEGKKDWCVCLGPRGQEGCGAWEGRAVHPESEIPSQAIVV